MDNDIINIYNLISSSAEEEIIQVRWPRVFKERTRYLDTMEEDEFKRRYRLSKVVVKFIIELIRDKIKHKTDR